MKKILISLMLACFAVPVSKAGDHVSLFPAETIALVSVDSWDAAAKLWDDPKFVPIPEDEREFQDADFADQFGMTVETFGKLVDGRVTRAILSPDALTDGTTVIVADVDPDTLEGWKKDAGLKQLEGETYSLAFVDSKKKNKTACYLFLDGKIAFSQQSEPLNEISTRAAPDAKKPSLADEDDWKSAASQLVTQEEKENAVRFTWFSRPQLEVMEKELAEKDTNVNGMFRRHGLDAVSVLAGSLQQENASATGEMSVSVLAAKPYRSTLAIFNPVEAPAVSVPDWAFETGRSGTVLLLDFSSAARNVAVLFDETYAEGIEGTYFDLLEDIKSEDGMGLDLETELFAKLGPTLISLADDAEKTWLMAVETSDAKDVAEVVRLLLEDDPDVKRETFDGIDGTVWKMVGTDDMPDSYLHVSGGYLFYTSTPQWIAAVKDGQNSQEMEQRLKEVQAAAGFGNSREVVGLTWLKPDQDSDEEYSAANGLRGWFLGDYLESENWWNDQKPDEEAVTRFFDTPLNSRNGFYGSVFQEDRGGWTFYWKL